MENYFLHPNRAKENSDGPFYTVDIGCDCGCELPEHEAPELLKTTNDKRYQTYFFKQPETDFELISAIEAVNICDIHDIRYGGTNRNIIRSIDQGKSDYIISEDGSVVLNAEGI